MAKYLDSIFQLTPRFICALEEVLRAEMEMMRNVKLEDADCWTWGMCEIVNLESAYAFRFEYGGENTKPRGFPEGTDVWVKSN